MQRGEDNVARARWHRAMRLVRTIVRFRQQEVRGKLFGSQFTPRANATTKFLIQPDARWRIFMRVLVHLTVLYNTVVAPLRAGFGVQFVPWLFYPAVYAVEYATDVLLMLDMLARSREAFLEKGQLVTDTARIWRRYRSSRLALDTISVCFVPVEVILVLAGEPVAAAALRCLRLARCVHLASLLVRFEGFSWVNAIAARVLRLLFWVIFWTHVLGCAWFRIGLESGLGGWPHRRADKLAGLRLLSLAPMADGGAGAELLATEAAALWYADAAYWAVATVMDAKNKTNVKC